MTNKRMSQGRFKEVYNNNDVPVQRKFNSYIVVDGVDYTLKESDSGKNIYLSTNAKTLTLPSPKAGLNFKILIKKNTAATHVIATSSLAAEECFFGSITVYKTDTVGVSGEEDSHQVLTYAAAIAAATDYNYLSLNNGDTARGGNVGDIIHLEAIDTTAWFVHAKLGTSAIPAAIAVIRTD